MFDGGIGGDSDVAVEIMPHSFSSPFQYDSSYLNWFLAGSAVSVRSVRSSVVLTPPIPNRHGLLLNTKKLAVSNNFDVSITLHLDDAGMQYKLKDYSGGSNPVPPLDQSVAFVLSARNLTADLQGSVLRSVKRDSLNYNDQLAAYSVDKLLVVPSRFEGVAVVLTTTDSTGSRIPTISIVNGDGNREIKHGVSFPNQGSVPLSPVGAQLMYLKLKIRVRPSSVSVLVQDIADWRSLVEVNKVKVPETGFVGLTSFSGSADSKRIPYRVRLSNFHLKSFDFSAVQDPQTIALFRAEGVGFDNIADSPEDQIHVVRGLIQVLGKHTQRCKPMFEEFQLSLSHLQNRINSLDEFLVTLTSEAKVAFKASGGKLEGLHSLMRQVRTIQSTLTRADHDRDVIVKVLKETAQDSKEIDRSASLDRHMAYYERQMNSRDSELSEAVASQSRFTVILFLLVLGVALLMGFSFYLRIRRYASKDHAF